MKSASYSREKHQNHHFLKKEKFHYTPSLFFYLTCLTLTTLLSFHLFAHRNIKNTPNTLQYSQTNTFITNNKDNETCDLFKGQWIRDTRDPLYTNYTCNTIPFLKNCFLHGRKDRDFLHWRWKPHKCELPRFRPEMFLSTLRGKTMAFIGDSLARNQMESLLCLLSTVETPKQIEKDTEDKFTTWEFPKHNFTLMVFWSHFLVTSTDRLVNGTSTGSFHIHLDKVDPRWSKTLPSLDYAVFSDAHWFFRDNYLYEDGNLIGCVYCHGSNMTALGPGPAISKAFRATFKAINDCESCRKIVTYLRTYSPSHFENGAWDAGGGCNGTWPVMEVDRNRPDWEFRRIQVEEVEIARNAGEGNGKKFEVIDVTEIMSMRRDGHPGVHWGNQWMKGYSDCIHWCMPGPVDVWNEFLFEMIKRESMVS